jgi:uncharacterized protein YbaR (Trm112 family)
MISKIFGDLRCPRCASRGGGRLVLASSHELACDECESCYPIKQGLPVLITTDGDFLNLLGEKYGHSGGSDARD